MEAAPTTAALFGRDDELAHLARLLDDAATGTAMLVLRGPRGCGISALIDVATVQAAEREMLVLRVAGVEAERAFAYAGLQQLLRPMRRAIEALPAPQRAALHAAFGLSDAPTDRFRVAMATLALVSLATRAGAVLVCVDEAQWLDDDTVAVLGLLARRLSHEPVALLVGTHGVDPLAEVDADARTLGPLPEPCAAALVDARAPDLPGFVRERVLQEAAGNPLALSELPLAMANADDGALLASWAPLTQRLAEAFAGGLDDLPADARLLLLVAALDDGARIAPVLDTASALADRPLTAAALTPAVDAGLVVLDGPQLSFVHPLSRAAIRRSATPAQRQAAHAAFAATVAAEEPDRATWHRVVGAAGVDEGLADALEAAGLRARDRGDFARATAALRRAARLTPSGPIRDGRLVAAAELAYELGGVALSDRLLDGVAADGLDPVARGRLTALRQRTGAPRGEQRRSQTLAGLAREAAAGGDRALALRLLWHAAGELEALGRGGHDAAVVLAAATEIADDPLDPTRLSILAALDARGHEEEILAGLSAHAPDALPPDTQLLLGHAAIVTGDPHRAVDLLARAVDGLRAQGRLTTLGPALALSAWARVSLSDWDRAEREAAEADRLSVQVRQPMWSAVARSALGLVCALRGDEAAAAEHAAAAERVAVPARAAAVLALVQQARGMLALSAGRPAEAFGHLQRPFDPTDPAYERLRAASLIGDLAEAATTDQERALVARLLDELPPSQAPALRIAVAHARLVLADDADADAAYARACARAAGERWPLQDARMLLVHGMRLRRARRVSDSREPLRQARAIFAALGATPWAERAARELAATAETTHRGPQDADRLTPQELQIAQMAARGLSNREIAATLSLSPRTVGAHLSHIYGKLGIGSRGAIAQALEG